MLLKQHEVVGGGLVGDAFESKRLGSRQDVVEATDDGKRCLFVISNCDVIPIDQLEVRSISFMDISAASGSEG
jgi:hypothetical protein